MEEKIKKMSKAELIQNIGQALLVIRNRRGIKNDSKVILRQFLWSLWGTVEYKEFAYSQKEEKNRDTSWTIHDQMPDFEEKSVVDKLVLKYVGGLF